MSSSQYMDEFDQFCQIAKNPSNKYRPQLTIENEELNAVQQQSQPLYRSRSVRHSGRSSGMGGVSSCLDKEEVNKIVRVRSFRRTTKGGIVCNKDTLEVANNEESFIIDAGGNVGAGTSGGSQQASRNSSIKMMKSSSKQQDTRGFIVQVLGLEGVGKSSLVEHLLVPEDLEFQYEESDPKQINRSIRILVDDKESVLHLVDCDASQLSCASTYIDLPDAYLIMYAVDDRQSFDACRKLLANVVLTNENAPVVILIANKADLVRSRVVSLEEGKRLASVYNLKFKEISTSLDHCVDELLVTLVTEIRNHQNHRRTQNSPRHHHHGNQQSSPLNRRHGNQPSPSARHFNNNRTQTSIDSPTSSPRQQHHHHQHDQQSMSPKTPTPSSTNQNSPHHNNNQSRSSLRSKVSHNPFSRFFNRHFNKSSDTVSTHSSTQ